MIIGGYKGGGIMDALPLLFWASDFFQIHAVFGTIYQIHIPTGWFMGPPGGKHGYSTVLICF